jgi:N-acetylneuraminic acid mutarotase
MVGLAPTSHIDAVGALVGGKLYLMGGYLGVNPVRYTAKVDVLDPTTGTWITKARPTPAKMSHVASAVVDDRYVYLAGGFRPDKALVCNVDPVCEYYGSTQVWKYDTQTDTYQAAPPLPAPRGSGSMTLVGRTLHFVSGLALDRSEQVDHWTLDVDTGTSWVADVPLPLGEGRNHFGVTLLNGVVYVVGGQTGLSVDFNTILLKSVLALDLAQPELGWVHKADLPAVRSHTAQTTLTFNCVILTAGGDSPPNKGTSTLWQYDPTVDQWSAVPGGLPDGRYGAVLQTDQTKLLYTGGSPAPYIRKAYVGLPG